MHLDRRACQDYYCSQLQNGGSYFQGVSHQRGYGMFSNLFRMISPIGRKIFRKTYSEYRFKGNVRCCVGNISERFDKGEIERNVQKY
ncbi:hypothetical protein TNCT_712391 [Trichonephila clavata]|uniref:Uncharacterized protein n=1 Tax=Trichonephila clavata TaxID=2740835 RepID=A0A8X6KPK4_TRICU|nr:hypothetical protein TNCT_712391 [Trichonephila clavata]